METLSIPEYDEVCTYISQKIEGKLVEIDERKEFLARKLEAMIFRSIDNGNFKLIYQPHYNLEGKTHGAEALSFVGVPKALQPPFPKKFNNEVVFYLLEKHGLDIEKWVVSKQIEMLAKDISDFTAYDPDYIVSLNVSLSCLDKDFVKKLKKQIDKKGIKGSNIQIEILEKEDFDSLENYREIFSELEELGVTFALDDFGSINATGIKAIRSYNYNTIKFDRGMLKKALNDDFAEVTEWCNIIKHIHPNAKIIMEGVDWYGDDELKEKMLQGLSNAGVTSFQGYGFAFPETAEKLVDRLKIQSTSTPPGMNE